MNRSRALLLAVMFSLLAVVGWSRANAVPCFVCECFANCTALETACLARCTTDACRASCETSYALCNETCTRDFG
jgi:hypothetical protein